MAAYLLATLFLLGALAVGGFFVQTGGIPLRTLRRPPLLDRGSAVAYGLGIHTLIWSTVGCLFTRDLGPTGWFFLWLVVIIFAIQTRRISISRPLPLLPTGPLPRVLAAVAALAWLLSLAFVTKPHLNYDVLSYHLPIAHLAKGDWRDVHAPDPEHFAFDAHNFYSRLPRGDSILLAAGLSNRKTTLDDPATRLLLWAAAVGGALLCGRVVGQFRGRPFARWLAVALYAWHPMVWTCLLNAQTDLFTALFALAALERLLAGCCGGTIRPFRLIASGLLAGLAVSMKFSALGIAFVPLCLGGALLFLQARRIPNAQERPVPGNPFARLALGLGMLLLGFVLAMAPWWIRAWQIGGHPLHPFLGDALGYTAEQMAFNIARHRPVSVVDAAYWQGFLRELPAFGYPLALVPANPESGERGLSVSILLVLALVAVALPSTRRRAAWLLLVAGLGYGAFCLVQLNPDRFALPAFALVLCAAALGVERLTRTRIALGGGAVALLLLAGAFNHLRGGYVPAALADREDWLAQREGMIPSTVLEFVWNDSAEDPSPGATLLLFEARSRLFPPPVLSNTVWDVPPWADDLKASATPEEFSQRLQDRDVVCVVVNEFELGRLVDFYGGLEEKNLAGRVGSQSDLELLQRVLAAYPPSRFAGLTDRDVSLLADFLRWARRNADVAVPAGPGAEIYVVSVPRASRP